MHISECEFEQRPDVRLRRSYAKGIPDFSQKLRAQQVLYTWYPLTKACVSPAVTVIPNQVWLWKSKEFPELEYCGAEASIKTKIGVALGRIHKPNWSRVIDTAPGSGKADEIIQRILYAAVDPDLRDEDESAPTFKVIQETVRLIRGAEKLLDAMPSGQVSTFYGEINITWRAGERIVRLACFPERPSVVQSGSLSLPVGSYRSEENPTAELLADRINSLAL